MTSKNFPGKFLRFTSVKIRFLRKIYPSFSGKRLLNQWDGHHNFAAPDVGQCRPKLIPPEIDLPEGMSQTKPFLSPVETIFSIVVKGKDNQ